MAHVDSENVQIASAIESATPGVLPGSPAWRQSEPNSIDAFFSDAKKVIRSPLSRIRAMRKGTIVDLDANPEFTCDLTKDVIDSYIEGIMYSATKCLTAPVIFVPTAVTAGGYTVASGGASILAGFLLYARNFNLTVNNGLQVAAASSTGTSIKVTAAAVETPPGNCTLEMVGVRGASGDLTLDASNNLLSTVLDFTTLGLTVGQWVWLGGTITATQFVSNLNRGFARIRAIAAHQVTLDRHSWTVTGVDAGTAKTVDIYFGRFLRNVARDSADYKEVTYNYEIGYPDLNAPGTPEYEYANGCYHSKWTVTAPLTNKATVKITHVGLNMTAISTTRATNAASAVTPVCTEAINTSTSFNRLRIALQNETDISVIPVSQDIQSITLSIMNNCSGVKVLGTLGPKYVNIGKFQCEADCELLLTNDQIIAAVANNTVMSIDFATRNTDFCALWDLPAVTAESAAKKFPNNGSVTVSPKFMAFNDTLMGYTLGISVFGYCPAS